MNSFSRLYASPKGHVLFFGLAFLMFFLSYTLNVWGGFYEDSRYLYYLISFLQDFDFNIINQVPTEARWLVTEKFFHPDFHTDIQTPFLLVPHLVSIIGSPIFQSDKTMGYFLSSFALHGISLYFGFFYCKKIGDLLGIKVKAVHSYLFLFGSSLFYFSFLFLNVLEIFTFPMLAYLTFSLIQLRKRKESANPWVLGSVLAVLGSIKVTYSVICIYTAGSYLYSLYNSKNIKFIGIFLTASFVVLTSIFLNAHLRHDGIFFNLNPYRFILDFSLSNAVNTFGVKYFGPKGLFSANPVLIIALIGFFQLLFSKVKTDLLNRLDAIALSLWLGLSLFQTAFIIGNTTEDHLVGRTYFTALPLFFIGFSYFLSETKEKSTRSVLNLFLIGSVIWALTMTLIFVTNDLVGHFTYAKSSLFDSEILNSGFSLWKHGSSQNLARYYSNFGYISFFFVFTFGVLLWLSRKFKHERIFYSWVLSGIAIYLGMSILNQVYAPKNIEQYLNAGFYKDKVIGNGDEIFAYDYIFDIMNVIHLSGTAEQRTLIANRKEQYLTLVKSQLVQSTPSFDKELRERTFRSSIFYEATPFTQSAEDHQKD